jgi:diaminohydroxyphosphoribosylaminopyrimidine deaminase/5-amino-6-(5-phosphoribosylamino)uracil reductase
MSRCIELAKLGAGNVAPNPMVGAVLVYEDRIIGEGFHEKYGEAHAEVNCISKAIQNGYADLLSQSIIYVSLEPCAHFGKTPPCADLIIKHKIPKVIIGCRDPFKEVDGKGIEKLEAAGVGVECGILEEECKELNKRFFTFHTRHRPYIILKWAQTSDKKISGNPGERLLISNEYTNRLVHQWRSEEAAILVGTNTVINDNPELTTRLWPGNSPVRLVLDMQLRLPLSLKIFNQQGCTIIFNTKKHSPEEEWSPVSKINAITKEKPGTKLLYYQLTENKSIVHQIATALYQLNIQSLIVEGGGKLLQSFINEDTWDEARVISNTELVAEKGIDAPVIKDGQVKNATSIFTDNIEHIEKISQVSVK